MKSDELPTASAAPSASAAPGDHTSFRPFEGGNEMQSGEWLMVEAYAAIWIIVFGFVFFSWRRQKAIDARVEVLEGAIAKVKAGAR